MSVYGGLFLVDCSPCRLIFRFPIVVLINLSRCFLINIYVSPDHVLRKPNLTSLIRLAGVGINSAERKFCASSGLVVWTRILFTTIFIVAFPGGIPAILSVCSC